MKGDQYRYSLMPAIHCANKGCLAASGNELPGATTLMPVLTWLNILF